MTDKRAIADAARPLFATQDDLERRLALTKSLIAGLGKSYARADGVPFVRPEAFRRECRA